QVARLDVAMSDPGVPQLADQQQPLVDHTVADVGLADFDGAGEELGDEQVLTLGRHLDNAVGSGRADPDVLQQAQRVVLVGDQAPHRLEGGLILQRAVEDAPPQLVPAIGAHVPLGVQLREQVLVVAPLNAQPQGHRAGRRLQADRLDLEHVQPELVVYRRPDRLAAPAADIDMSGPAAAVHDREHLVRGEEAERRDRYRHPERDAEQHVIRVVDRQVHPGQAGHGDDHGNHDLGVGAGAARHNEAVHRTHENSGQLENRDGRRRVPGPAADDGDAVRPRPRQAAINPLADYNQEEVAAEKDQQVPPAPEDHGQHHHRQ